MKVIATPLSGAFLLDLEPRSDERGFFARTFCAREFQEHGLSPVVAQGNLAYSPRKGTLRGMHYQLPPEPETKVVRCTRGAVYDVIVDLRPASPTYLKHFGIELTADNRRALYIPEMFAHGFLTLEDHTETSYLVGGFYNPELRRGFRYNDPRFSIQWPAEIRQLAPRDAEWPDFRESAVHPPATAGSSCAAFPSTSTCS